MSVVLRPLARFIRYYVHLLIAQVRCVLVDFLFTLSRELLVRHIVQIILMPTHLHLNSLTVLFLGNFFNLVL